MPTFTAEEVNKPAITVAQAGQIGVSPGEVSLPNTLAANDLVKLCKLPAEHEPVDFFLDSDDLDTNVAPTITISVGILNAAGDDLTASTNFLTDSTVAQAGGIARAAVSAGLRLAASNADRIVAAKITNVAATKAAGTLRGVLLFKPKRT